MLQHIGAHFFMTLLMYFFIFLSLRIMGKREIGKLSVFDLTISILIAEIAVFAIDDIKRPLYTSIVPMGTLVLLQVALAQFSLKSRKLRLFMDGKPSILISDGKIQRKEMRKLRYNIDDLLLQLRGQNITSPADVEFAILEPTGQLTVIEKSDSVSSSNRSGNSSSRNSISGSSGCLGDRGFGQDFPKDKIRYEGLPVPLIMDGKVQDDNLEMIGKTRFWLRNEIRQQGVSDFRDVFLCSIDHKGKLYVDPLRPK
ncbi:uncharacterized membrane protein YcaP (DUF421 family) [Paenibacillus forsythiae]|uniref:Uncharacterized membrane protein YcaP (DUF421 family) n=1 Tax=Paenibacillus forsythiae TaxID=365616 RepID=A0ABU3H755_9BACL|nr:DUF421 domain-containing protein [Paenibacillus forsythiae]MDT3426658.1 uncharacterized membrane protein YcaP (DUF421 family) [Paenibacillus forsythiae]